MSGKQAELNTPEYEGRQGNASDTNTPADFLHKSSIYNCLSMAWDETGKSSLRFEWKSERPLSTPHSCLHSITDFEATGCSLPQSHVLYSNWFIFDSLTTASQTKKLPIYAVWSHICLWASTAGTLPTSTGHDPAPPDHKTGALMVIFNVDKEEEEFQFWAAIFSSLI